MASKSPEVVTVWEPNPGPQTEYLRRDDDLVLFGGSKGPGKTDALLADATGQIDKPGYKALLVRRTFPQIQEMIDRAHSMFPKMGGKWNGELRRYNFPPGSYIEFGSCDAEIDKERYQGHEYQFIGFDQLEQFSEGQFDFICAQLRTTDASVRCYIRATANPGGVGHWWVKRRFIDNKPPNVTHDLEFVHPFDRSKRLVRTYCYVPALAKDNPKLQESYLATLASIKNESERRAWIYGDWEAFTTDCVFDRSGMAAQDAKVEDPAWRGRLVDQGGEAEFQLDEQGELLIWRQPVAGQAYFIFADPSYGKTSGDFSPAGVYKYGTNELVALWYGKADPTLFGKIIYGLGMYFNWAKVAVEVRPGPGIATVGKLVELDYPHLYHHLKWDGAKHVETEEIGWVTDVVSRGDMIASGKDSIRNKTTIVRARLVLDEMLNFIRHPNGKEEARSECHDDLVIMHCGAMKCMSFDPVDGIVDGYKDRGKVVVTGGVRLPGKQRSATISKARSREGALAGFK